MSHADVLPAASGRRRRWHLGLPLLIAALAVCVLPGAAEAKKKRDKIGVATYNLYLGSDLGPATAAGLARRTDGFADEVGFVLKDVLANDFQIRAKHIANDIKKRKVDLVGLQEAALWKLQTPTDGSGLNPAAQRALNPVVDYIDELLEELNRKAKTGAECKQQDIPKSKCFRGYKLVVAQQEADLEFLGDFDNDPGPDGTTFDVSTSGSVGATAPGLWLRGNDDSGVSLGEPPAAQCSDGIDNDGDTLIDYGPNPATNEESGPAAGDADPTDGIQGTAAPYACESRLDNSETDVNPTGADPNGLPQDANFDHNALAGNHPDPIGSSTDNGTPFCPAFPTPCPESAPASPISYDGGAMGLDAPGVTDCQDNSADDGPEDGTPGWPFSGVGYAENTVPVCLFHGIDGDISLTMRDAILKRKGAGVKTKNPTSGNFSSASTFQVNVFGRQIPFTRGWTATDARVRGKSFRFVNTHLESESEGQFREDQASELIAPGGPADNPTTVLVGDLNSDPNRAAANLPNGDGGSNIAINRLFAAGFTSLVNTPGIATGSHGDHGDVINDPNDLLGEGWIDHILTNDPGAIKRKGKARILDGFEDGLWQSDHAGVMVRIKGTKR